MAPLRGPPGFSPVICLVLGWFQIRRYKPRMLSRCFGNFGFTQRRETGYAVQHYNVVGLNLLTTKETYAKSKSP